MTVTTRVCECRKRSGGSHIHGMRGIQGRRAVG